jgi:hypothetical protein
MIKYQQLSDGELAGVAGGMLDPLLLTLEVAQALYKQQERNSLDLGTAPSLAPILQDPPRDRMAVPILD